MMASGFYHCSVKNVGRSNGRSIVAAAAYRSGERLADERTGETADYRARGGVVDTFILARDDAPAWAHDRARLWNEAERAEARVNGRLATEFELALPHELTDAQRKQLLKDYLAPIIEKHGIAADVAIHAPGEGKDHRNIHAHVLLTHRELGASGFGDIANTRIMSRKRKGREVQEQVAGIAATPADIKAIRKGWEQAVNREYERAGLDIRVDHRSHEERGIEQEPTKHLGPTVIEMEKDNPGSSDRAAVNWEITQRNAARILAAMHEAEVSQIKAEIIDVKADLAMQEARAAAVGRYDRLDETHRQVARDQFPGRYDDLRAAEPPPEVVREFEANANRAAEPAAPIYDRDQDNAAWEAKLAENAINAEAQKGHEQPAAGAGKEARAGGPEPSGGMQQRPEPEDMRPLGKMAGEIRMAWTISRTAEELEEALAARGISLAEVSPEEAQQSQRTAAFAKEVGNFARSLRAGEIVAVDQYGAVHRFDQRTTGDLRPEIEARFDGFGGIDRAGLLDVAAAKEAMQEAARAAWRDERRAEREQARPASAIETAIAAALSSTKTGTEFAAALDKAGLAVTRATSADVQALDALREQEGFDRESGLAHKHRHFATLLEGDFAAVNRRGDVFQLSPQKLDVQEIEQRLADVQPRLPSVIEARAAGEIEQQKTADLWAARRADNALADRLRGEIREEERAERAQSAQIKGAIHDVKDAANTGLDIATGMLGGLAKVVEKTLGGFFRFFVSEPKFTPQQQRDHVRAETNEETLHARAYAAAEQQKEAEAREHTFNQDRQQQQEDFAARYGVPGGSAGRSRERDDDYDRGRERDRP